jgi:hypothetical protein
MVRSSEGANGVVTQKQAESGLSMEKTYIPRGTIRVHHVAISVAIAQAFIHRLLDLKTRRESRNSGISGGQSGAGTCSANSLYGAEVPRDSGSPHCLN